MYFALRHNKPSKSASYYYDTIMRPVQHVGFLRPDSRLWHVILTISLDYSRLTWINFAFIMANEYTIFISHGLYMMTISGSSMLYKSVA